MGLDAETLKTGRSGCGSPQGGKGWGAVQERRGETSEWVGIYPPLLNEVPGGGWPAPSLTILCC